MPPTNTSFATATDLGSLPADITQNDINDAGVNYTVYYKLTAPAAQVIGAWAFSGNIGSGYRPTIEIFKSDETPLLNIAAQNKPVQFPVTQNELYYIRATKNIDTAGPEEVRVRVEVAPDNVIRLGDIIVNDDTAGFPLAALSVTDNYTVRKFVKNIAAGEGGDILTNGISFLTDEVGGGQSIIYNPDWSVRANVNVGFALSGSVRVRGHRATNKFHLAEEVAGDVKVVEVSANGVVGTTYTIPVSGFGGISLSDDETIIYISTGHPSNLINAPVKRWDIAGGAFISDLVGGIANYATKDILILNDGTILVAHNKTTGAPWDVIIRRYDSAGNTLNTYTVNGGVLSCILGYALDDPDSFWVWTHDLPEFGNSIFTNIRTSDGVVLNTKTHAEYEGGAYQASETATPTSRFGNSFSCPFFIMTVAAEPGLFVIVPDKRTDHNTAIPTPTFRTALLP